MPSYLERYRQGEFEQVWSELLGLGDKVRKKPLHAEALSVAKETMTRARANIEMLVPRLQKLGYQFAHPERVFVPADKEFRRHVVDMEKRGGPLPLSLRAWCEVVGEVNFMGSHPKLSTYVQMPSGQEIGQGFLSLFAKHGGVAAAVPSGQEVVPGLLALLAKQQGGAASAAGDSLRQSFELTQSLLNEVVQGIKTGQPARSPNVAAGLRASQELLGQFQRPPAALERPDVESDPLVVEPYFMDLEDAQDDDEDDADSHTVIIAPDSTHKTNHSGGSPYAIDIPNSAADAPLDGDENYGTFVEYLRTCFRWGGFPGLRASKNPPREELAFLTQGLLSL
jgi:hypothetical protein